VARPAEHQGCGGRRGVGGTDEVGHGRSGDGGPAGERRYEPANGRAWPRRPPRGPSGRGRRAQQATADRAPRGSCSALRAERSLPLVCNDRFGGFSTHRGNYLHCLVTARVKSLSGNCARATVSALLGRRATSVGRTVVAGKETVSSGLGVPIGPTSWTSSPIAGVARAAQTALTSLLLR